MIFIVSIGWKVHTIATACKQRTKERMLKGAFKSRHKIDHCMKTYCCKRDTIMNHLDIPVPSRSFCVVNTLPKILVYARICHSFKITAMVSKGSEHTQTCC